MFDIIYQRKYFSTLKERVLLTLLIFKLLRNIFVVLWKTDDKFQNILEITDFIKSMVFKKIFLFSIFKTDQHS